MNTKSTSLGILVIILLFTQCSITRQSLSQSHLLSPGMTKQEVSTVMGAPIKSDFDKNVEEWFYCKTGMGSDQHLALFFHEGVLVAKKNYNVSMADTRGVSGSCENFIKQGSYATPDAVLEIRMSY